MFCPPLAFPHITSTLPHDILPRLPFSFLTGSLLPSLPPSLLPTDGLVIEGKSFGAEKSMAGEIVSDGKEGRKGIVGRKE